MIILKYEKFKVGVNLDTMWRHLKIDNDET